MQLSLLTDINTIAPPPTGPRPKITDVGQKIGGAKKDLWHNRPLCLSDLDEITDTELHLAATKDNIWPAINYEAALEGGTTREHLAFLKLVRDMLPASSGSKLRDVSALYIATVSAIRRLVETRTVTVDQERAKHCRESWQMYQLSQCYTVTPSVRNFDSELDAALSADGFRASYEIRRIVLRLSNIRSKMAKLLSTSWPEKKATPARSATTKPRIHSRPHLDRLARVGDDVLAGRQIAGSDYLKAFSFRAVEFGNYLADTERQAVLNLGYEAFADLAWALEVPTESLALGGRLALAFGARGSGHASAHFEPDTLAINLTKIRGAGSLAHEMAHAIDELLSRAAGNGPATKFFISGRNIKTMKIAHLARPVREAIAAIALVQDRMFYRLQTHDEQIAACERSLANVDALIAAREASQARYVGPDGGITNPTGHDRIAGELEKLRTKRVDSARELQMTRDGEIMPPRIKTSYLTSAMDLGEYWARPIEMFARAFEAWLYDKLRANNRQSDYLVHGVAGTEDFWTQFGVSPYPLSAERAAINAAFDVFAQTLRHIDWPRNE